MKTVIGLIAFLVAVSQWPNEPLQKWEDSRKIYLTGSASIEVATDFITIKIGIETRDKLYSSAFAKNAAKVKAVLSVLSAMGVPQKDISNDFVSLSKAEVRRIDGVPVYDGYDASQRITVVLWDLQKYDAVLSSIIGAGVDNIESVSFGVSNEPEKRKEARLLAVKAAKEKADAVAQALGQKVCAPLKIQVNDEAYRSSNVVLNYSGSEVESFSRAPAKKTITASVEVVFILCE